MKLPPYERLENLPGVGPSIADDYRRLGVTTTAQLADMEPEELFDRLEQLDGPTDRCVLYVFRCVRYAVRTAEPDHELLNWWKWNNG
ncbi:MAG: helix-hairpin-helix domain-containing protein [Lacisediminihabitans sp.]